MTQQEGRNPAQAPPSILNGAFTTMRQLGLRAATELDDVSEEDLRPSDRGAELLIDRGLLDEERFCTAHRIVVEAEASAAARSRFASGRRASAPQQLDDEGAAMFEALSTGCSAG